LKEHLIALSPVVYLKHLNTNWDALSLLYRLKGLFFLKLFKIHKISLRDPTDNKMAFSIVDFTCKHVPFICGLALRWISDRSPSVLDLTNFAFYLKHYPSSSSVKCLDHFGQLSQLPEGEFRKFDYGKDGNLKKYGSEEPPQYDLSKVVF
jgi:hypothetical protein